MRDPGNEVDKTRFFFEKFFVGKTMFKKAVRISVDICPADCDKQEESTIHTISIVLESGQCPVPPAILLRFIEEKVGVTGSLFLAG